LSVLNPGDPNPQIIGGLQVIGDRLVVAGYSMYDGEGSAKGSHFVRSTNLSDQNAKGPIRVGTTNPGFVSAYMAPIPTEWQSALGGDMFSGACCMSVIGRTSMGPAASALTKSTLLSAPTNMG